MIDQTPQMWSLCFSLCGQQCIQRTMTIEFRASLLFSIGAIIVSIYNVYMHFINFNNPFFQSKIIVILLMAPFYCITSMGSFVFPHQQIYFTLTRDSYEAVLLFTFFYLMFAYLAYDRQKDEMQDKKVYVVMIKYEKEVHHFFPFYYCQKPYQLTHWKKAKYFTYRCKKYVLQFLVVKLLTTFFMYIIYPKQNYQPGQMAAESDEGSFKLISGLFSWIVAISASYSLYYLVLFYHALSKPLAPYSALLKFLTIKITIFFTFWQKIMLVMFEEQIVSCFDHNAPSFNHTQIISSLQNTLICFEMLLMSIGGGIAYDYENYVSQNSQKRGNFTYVIKDTLRAFKSDFRLIKPKKFGFDSTMMEEIELRELKKDERTSLACEINICKVNMKQSIKDSMKEDYL